MRHFRFSLLLLFSMCSMFVASCECKDNDDLKLVPNAIQDFIPYQNGDPVIWVNQSADTIALTVTDRISYFVDADGRRRSCPGEETEVITVNLDSTNGFHYFAFGTNAYTPGRPDTSQATMALFGRDYFDLKATENQVIINSKTRYIGDQFVNNTYYLDVYELDATNANAFYTKIWIAPGAGFVRAMATNGSYWEVVP